MSFNTDNEDPLEAALSQAFSPPPSRRHSLQHPVFDPAPQKGHGDEEMIEEQQQQPGAEQQQQQAGMEASDHPPAVPAPSDTDAHTDMDADAWKAAYEAQVQAWRAQSAEQRAKAERERARWEAVRAAEREQQQQEQQEQGEHRDTEWETVTNSTRLYGGSELPSESSVADSSSEQHALQSQAARMDDSQRWEHIHQVTSFPMTSTERTTTSPSTRSIHYVTLPPMQPVPQQPPLPLPPPPTATLAVFDSSLSTRTRVKALLSSLAINLLLPFVNGVMLGFGEIFAKNVLVGWFGWNRRPIVSSLGLMSRRPKQEQR
ncbi:hypothetical protein AMATHDRAFT_55442 [Amanita thiersii Skay4041]|uniref:TOM13-domain-containing protein n=1 Tax=Amanita thiersii Skay4041 TaxID=703135 RepID=A0A2A9NYY9_9AGAR|nr:hypothetical protein AMATHDRAFT_55442 [Amanita thiersii Skay4041]